MPVGDFAPAKKLSMSASLSFLLVVPTELILKFPSRNGRKMRNVFTMMRAFASPGQITE